MMQIPTNAPLLREILTGFIRNEVQKTGMNRVVVGLSGGVDSALSAMLAAEALGAKNVLAVLMPYKNSNPDSLAHAEMVAQKSNLESLVVDITPQIDAYFDRFPGRRRAAARQQDGARAHDDTLRSFGALERLGDRHEQQNRTYCSATARCTAIWLRR